MMHRLLATVVAPVLLAGSLAACGTDEESSGVRVAAGFYPLAWVAEQVGGEHVSVSNLTSPGGEPHDLELTVKETADIAEADLVIHEEGLQPAVDSAIGSSAGGTVLDAASVVRLKPFAEEEGHDEEGHEEEGHEDHGALDPHFWQDPLLMADLGDAVASALAGIDPDRAADYTANAADLRAELTALSGEYDAGLDGCTRTTVVVSHDAFGYLTRFGLTLAPIAGLSPGAEPTPADLQELHLLIRRDGITTVFAERLTSSKMSDTLAEDLGITTAVLDPIEGLTDETADEDYLSLMRSNLAALEEANGC